VTVAVDPAAELQLGAHAVAGGRHVGGPQQAAEEQVAVLGQAASQDRLVSPMRQRVGQLVHGIYGNAVPGANRAGGRVQRGQVSESDTRRSLRARIMER